MRLLLLPGCPTSRPRRLMPAVVDARQRNLMAAEFYGKEYVLFEGGLLNNAEGEGVTGWAWRFSAAVAARCWRGMHGDGQQPATQHVNAA